VKVLTVIGARPQFIKAAPVSLAFKERGVDEVLVHTGQHFDANMSDIFFSELRIPSPCHNLGIGGGSHGQNTGRMIEALEATMKSESPDWILVYGDTDSTLAGAVAAAKLHMPVVHVEAGLRSHNMQMPEEINRRLTDHVSTLLCAPSALAVENLAKESVFGEVVLVGDVMYDAALLFAQDDQRSGALLQEIGVSPKQYILATIHRQENTDDRARLVSIIDGLAAAPMPIVLPLHPRTRARLQAFDLKLPANIRTIQPAGYIDMVMLERNAALIATDSGGVQKEAYFHSVPCVTLRHETEWVELVELGWNTLARPGIDNVASVLAGEFKTGKSDTMPYGDGRAAQKIATTLIERTHG
jgi:UDP-GlcNAc3NAcA epimerase